MSMDLGAELLRAQVDQVQAAVKRERALMAMLEIATKLLELCVPAVKTFVMRKSIGG